MKKIILFFLAAVASFLSNARPIRYRLQGDELLMALVRDRGIGNDLPGIYALDGDGNVHLVVAYGREPRWSNDRRKVAFIGDSFDSSAVYVVDIKKMSYFRVSGEFLDTPVLPHDFCLRPKGIVWSPCDENIVLWSCDFSRKAWRSSPYIVEASRRIIDQDPNILFCATKLNSDMQKKVLQDGGILLPGLTSFPGKRNGVFGRISFRNDGVVAYEWVGHLAWGVGQNNPEVWIFDPNKGTDERLDLSLANVAAYMNPLWSPDGKWLAVDVVDRDDGFRSCILVSSDFQRTISIRDRARGRSYSSRSDRVSFGGLAWCPSSGKIMLMSLFHFSQRGGVSVFDISSPDEKQTMLTFGGPTGTSQACWSPDGEKIARIIGQPRGRSTYEVGEGRLNVVHMGAAARIVHLPSGMFPVSIDW